MVKNLPAKQETQVQSLGQEDPPPWRREWLLTPVFLPGEFYAQRSLEGYSPWGHELRVGHNWSDMACMHESKQVRKINNKIFHAEELQMT